MPKRVETCTTSLGRVREKESGVLHTVQVGCPPFAIVLKLVSLFEFLLLVYHAVLFGQEGLAGRNCRGLRVKNLIFFGVERLACL